MDRRRILIGRRTSALAKPTPAARLLWPKAVLCLVACALTLIFPVAAFASPVVTVSASTGSFTRVSGSVLYYYRSSEPGSSYIEISNSDGQIVWKKATGTIRASDRYGYAWKARASEGNTAGYETNNYVKSGLYKVRIVVRGKTQSTVRTKYVKVLASPKPRISSVSSSARIIPSAVPGETAFSAAATISHKNDVFVYIKSNKTGLRVKRLLIRDASPNTVLRFRWDGRVGYAGSVSLSDGTPAKQGDVAPTGLYSVYFVSNGTQVKRDLTIDDTPVSTVAVSSPVKRLRYYKTAQLSTSVLPSGAADKTLLFSSSDTSILKVSASGLITAQPKEGSATITVKARSNPEASAKVTIAVSDSTLAVKDFLAIPKWLIYKNSRKIAGTVSSNYPLRAVRIMVTDVATGEVEINQVVSAGGALTLSIAEKLNPLVQFGTLSAGSKEIMVRAADEVCTKVVYTQTFAVIGPTRYKTFWSKRLAGLEDQKPWVYPLDIKNPGNTSSFGAVRDGGARAHAAIDLIEPPGTKVYAMADGVVERISVGTYYAGTGAIQIKHVDGAVIWYCEVKASTKLKVGDKVRQNQVIATIQQNNYGTSMLHLEAYSGKSTGSLYNGTNVATYDNVTPVRFLRRRDLVYPHGVLTLPIPKTRVVESE